LAGKTLVFGSCDAAEATVLPAYYLKNQGVNFAEVKFVNLHNEVDALGTPCHSEHHVWQALRDGRGQAGVLSVRLWEKLQREQPDQAKQFTVVWTSPAFSHCVFTARKDFDKKIGARFAQLMQAMDGQDPVTGPILKLEGCGKWVAGGQEGFSDLLKALRAPPPVSFVKK
jgi:ABC-type phosphate/phosphonate transport system substrate-binding protein